MPRSPNRRYLEIPAPLYEQLAEQAKADGRTVAQLAADYITDGMTVHDWLIGIDAQLREIRRDLHALKESR